MQDFIPRMECQPLLYVGEIVLSTYHIYYSLYRPQYLIGSGLEWNHWDKDSEAKDDSPETVKWSQRFLVEVRSQSRHNVLVIMQSNGIFPYRSHYP
jgi:hypothetical protein